MSDIDAWLTGSEADDGLLVEPERDDSSRATRAFKQSFATAGDSAKDAYGAVTGKESYHISAEIGRGETDRYYRQPDDTERFTDIGSLGDVGNWMAGALGEAAGSGVQMLAGGGVGGAIGKAAGKAVLGTIAGSMASSAPVQMGQTVQGLRKESPDGKLPEGGAGVAAGVALFQSALDAVPFMSALKKVGFGGAAGDAASDAISKMAYNSALKRVGKDALSIANKEGFTEIAQDAMQVGALEYFNAEKDRMTWDQTKSFIDAYAAGFVGGGALGGVAGAASEFKRSRTESDESDSAGETDSGAGNAPDAGSLSSVISSGEGGYNSFNRGKAGDSPGESGDFASMTLGELMRLQSLPVGDTNRRFAVGKYQIIPTTMAEAVEGLGLSPDVAFTPELQETIFRDYLISKKRPAIKAFITGSLGGLKKALKAGALEWASIADPDTGLSAYGDRGNNKASVSSNDFAKALRGARKAYKDAVKGGAEPDAAFAEAVGVMSVDSSGSVALGGVAGNKFESPAEDIGLSNVSENGSLLDSAVPEYDVPDNDVDSEGYGSDIEEYLSGDVGTAFDTALPEALEGSELSQSELIANAQNAPETQNLDSGMSFVDFPPTHELSTAELMVAQLDNDVETEQKALDVAANESAESPLNDRPEPTEAQKEAGNYKKGHYKLHGLDVTIENPKGSLRKGVDGAGKAWESEMQAHYGDVRGTLGADGDPVDVFLGDRATDAELPVYVVDQVDPKTGEFDEHKVMIGYTDAEAARAGYLANYDKGWQGVGGITSMPVSEFKDWVNSPAAKQPVSDLQEVSSNNGLEGLKRSQPNGVGVGGVEVDNGVSDESSEKNTGGIPSGSEDGSEQFTGVTEERRTEGSPSSRGVDEKTGNPRRASEDENVSGGAGRAGFNKGVAPLADAVGESNQFATNKIFTPDAVEAARARLKKKLGNLNSGFDPEVMADGLVLAGAYIESGVRSFSDYSKAMIGDFGNGIKPYLLSFYEGVRHYPGLDTKGMDDAGAAAKLHKALLDDLEASDAVIPRAETRGVLSENEGLVSAKRGDNLRARQSLEDGGGRDNPLTSLKGGLLDADIESATEQDLVDAALSIAGTPEYLNMLKKPIDKDIARKVANKNSVNPTLGRMRTLLKKFRNSWIDRENDNKRSAAEFTERMGRVYGRLSKPELLAEIDNLNTLASSREFNGGSRRTGPAVNNEAVRAEGQHRMDLERYISERFDGFSDGNDAVNKEVDDVSSTTSDLAGNSEAATNDNGDLQKAVPDERGADSIGAGQSAGTSSIPNDRSSSEGAASSNGVDSNAAGSGPAATEKSTAGGAERGRGTASGEEGQANDRSSVDRAKSAVSEVDERAAKPEAKAKIDEPDKGAESGLSLAEKLVLQKQAETIKHKANDLDNIRETLPVLLPEQQDDVKFAEERFSGPNAFGVLFTNGTGTGKTFTGLGVAKRFHRQGKKNILIVVPSDKIARDWVSSAGYFDMPAKQLAGTKDNGGDGVVVTTYAAFANNPTLLVRDWDLVIPDEAHKLNQNAAGKDTIAQKMLDTATNKNIDSKYSWKHYAPDLAKWKKLQEDIDKALKVKDAKYPHFSDYFKAVFTGSRIEGLPELKMNAFDKRHKALVAKAEARSAKILKAKKLPERGRVVFLSATPFAYHKSMKYADGYLFDSNVTEDKKRVGSYNHAQGFDSFLQAKFGYQMKTGKLNRPDVEVDTSLAERNLNTELQKRGVLRGRRLVVDVDYSREFVLIDDGIGKKIDEGMRWLSDKREDYPGLSAQLHERFDYLARLQLLEAIKVKHAIARADKHIKLGRKVVMFHSFKQGGGFVHPFKFKETAEVSRDAIDRFNVERPDLVGLPLDGLPSPINRIKDKYGARSALFNGDVPKAKRNQAVKDFNDDAGSVDVILVQTDAGKEGISLHDTTGKYQRVLINLGLPTKPTDAIQIEGRTYRTGVKTNSIKEYLTTGLDYETHAFASAVARRSSTAENLALGHEGRNLLKAFVNAYNGASISEPSLQQGTGGKASDYDATESSQMDQAKLAYHTRQKNNKRRTEREGTDYYATPEPVGLKMVEWLGLKPGEHGAETSAGHGAIARWFPDHSKNTFVEQSYSLVGDLGMLGNGEVKHTDFMTFRPSRNFDGVAMNPPYGVGGTDAVKHSAKAFSHLRPGGRMVTLIPDGGATDTKFDKWYESDEARDAHIVATIKLPGVTFKKAGTGVRTKLVVIDRVPAKWIKEGAIVPQHRQLDYSRHEKVTDLFDELDEVWMADRVVEPKPDAKLSVADNRAGSSIDAVRASLSQKIGSRSKELEEAGKLMLVQSSAELPVSADANAAGAFVDGKVYLVADNIPTGEAYGVFLHEAGEHAGLEATLGAEKYGKVVQQFERLLKGKNTDAVRAAERVPGNTPDEQVASERLAYLVEDFTNKALKSGGAKMLAQRVIAAVKAWAVDKLPSWVTKGMRLSPADIQALAVRGARAWAADPTVKDGLSVGGAKLSIRDSVSEAIAKGRRREGNQSNDDADWADVDNDAPKEGLERGKELLGKSWDWVKNNASEYTKNGGLALLTLRQLVDISKEYLPSAGRYMARVDKMLAERNKMQDESAKLAKRWLGLNKTIKHRLSWVMHEATRRGVDPSAAEFASGTVSIRGGMDRVRASLNDEAYTLSPEVLDAFVDVPATAENMKLLNQLKLKRSRELKRKEGRNVKRENYDLAADGLVSAKDDWRRLKNMMLADDKKRKDYPALRKRFLALPAEAQVIFTEARDMYEARFSRTMEALLRDVQMAEMAESKKKALTLRIRHDFESATLNGIYFPLSRKGQYFVFGRRDRTDLDEVLQYRKNKPKVEEVVDQGTGEVKYQPAGGGVQYSNEADAYAQAGRWNSEENAKASANSRADLVGKSLVPVKEGDGWILEDNPQEEVFSMVQTAREAEALAAEFKTQGVEAVRFGRQDAKKTQDDLAALSGFMQVLKTMEGAGQAVSDDAYQAYLELLPDLSMRKNHIHRKGTSGYAEDGLNAFSGSMMHQAHQISKLEARGDLSRALEELSEESRAVGQDNAVMAGNVREEVKSRHDWVMNPSNAAWTNWTSSFGFFMYLGVSPAAALVNLTQTAVVAYPTLAAEFGWNKAGKMMMETARQLNMRETVMGDDAISRDVLNQGERDAMDHWHDSGAIDKSQAHSLAGIGDTDSLQNSPTYQKWMAKTAHLFHKAEVVNREVTLLTAYRLARAAGRDQATAVKMAEDMTWSSQFDYSNANRARIMQSDGAKLFLMFKSYSQHVIYYLMKNASDWGKGGKEGKKAQARLLGVLGMTVAMGGVSALPLGMVGLASAGMYGRSKFGTKKTLQAGAGMAGLLVMASLLWDDDEPFDWGVEVRSALRGLGGEFTESLVMSGPINALTGVNVSGRVSLESLLWREPNRELEGRDLATHYLKEAVGPVVGYGLNTGAALQLWQEDHGFRAAESLTPKFARDLMRTGRYGNEGALNLKGDALKDMDWLGTPFSDDLTMWNLLWQASGFTPEKLNRRYQNNSDYKKYEQQVMSGRQRLLSQYYLHYIERDGEGMRGVKENMQQWNKANPKAPQIDAKAISRSMKARIRGRKASMNGVHTNLNYRYLEKELGL